MSRTTFHLLRLATIGALLAAALHYDWPIVAAVLTVAFVLCL